MLTHPTRLVVVGYGMGSHHAKLINETRELELHGVCDLDPAKREKAQSDWPKAGTYAEYEKVLADPDVDGVIIVTPHNTHAAMAIAAMDAGKHAITDKAMCLTVDEARAMIAARNRNGVLLSTFHNRRWDPDFLTVRKVIEEKLLGRLYHIESCVTGYGLGGGWRSQREAMGGWLFDWGAHTLDQILLLARSRPQRVYAFEHYRHETPNTVEDFVSCTVTFQSGLTATTVVGYLNRIPQPRWYVLGEHATLLGQDFGTPVRVKGTLGSVDGELTVPLVKGEWQSFYQNIADTLAARANLEVQPEQLVPQIAIAQAAYRSIATNQVITVEF